MVFTPIYTSATEVYNKTGLTATEVNLTTYDTILEDAEAELERITGRKFTTGNSRTEYLDGPKTDILGITGNKATTINLSNYPIQSIISFQILDTNMSATSTYGTLTSVQIAAGTYYTTDYWLDTMEDPITGSIIPCGKITLISNNFPTGRNNIKVSYTYGYSSVPVAIRDLATCMAGIRAWIRFLGGSYNYLNSYSIPQQSVSKGDLYDRGQKMIDQLTLESNRLLDRIGRKPSTVFFASGQDR